MDDFWNTIIAQAIMNRKQLHQIPEPCWREEKTATFLEENLNRLSIEFRRCAGTGLVATVAKNARGQHVALRCDMDGIGLRESNSFDYVSSVNDCMHGCGHDGHMATMLATLSWLKLHEKSLPGPVTAIFQPAEEGGYGAREMISDGVLEGVDSIFGWHNWPAIAFGKAACAPGAMMAANASFSIELLGSGGHSSQPECCRDPILASAAVTLALQQVVSRNILPQNAGVVSVTSIDGKSSETVIPDRVKLAGSVRMATRRDIKEVGEKITQISCLVAKGYGVQAKVVYNNRYPAVKNNSQASMQFVDCFETVLGHQWQCQDTLLPIMASEDFSYYLAEIPGSFALVGAGDGGKHSVPCHNSHYDFNDHLIGPMVRIFSQLSGAPDPLNPRNNR